MTTLTERPETRTTDRDTLVDVEHPRRGAGWMWSSILLAVALIGLGAWFVADMTSDPPTAPTDGVATLIDDYHDAWNTNDGEALMALVTDDFVFDDGQASLTADATASRVNGFVETFGLEVVQLDDPQMVGDGPWYVSVANELVWNSSTDTGFSIFEVVDDAGTLLIASHTYVGTR